MAKTPTTKKLVIARVYVDQDGGFRIYVGKKAGAGFPISNGDYFRVELYPAEKKLIFTKLE